MPYEIRIENLNELRSLFKKATKIASKELETATKEAGKLILRTEKEEVPVKTAQLKRSITMDYRPISASIYPDVKHALPVHEGSKPHVISPKRKPFLAWKKNGKWIYTTKPVNHPGNKPNKFVERTVNKTANPVNKFFEKALDAIIKALSK